MPSYSIRSFIFSCSFVAFACYQMEAQCSGTPNPGTITSAFPSTCAAGPSTATLTASGLSSGTGISYQWQVSAGSSFTNVSGGGGATTPTYMTNFLPVGTYSFQLRSTCANSALSNTSNVFVINIAPIPTITTAGNLTPGSNATIVTASGTGPSPETLFRPR